MAGVRCAAGDAAALASPARRQPLDLSAPRSRSAADRQRGARAGLRLARENTGWGYVRIAGELRKLGVDVSATLVRNILKAAGVPPAPERDRLSWRSFLRQHAATTLACDFLTVDTVVLRRLYVLVFICVGSRRTEYTACTSNPDDVWMLQQARNLLIDLNDRGQQPRLLIHDRHSKFSRAFDALFQSDGITVVRTPVRAPNANPAHRALDRQRPARMPRRLLIFNRQQLERSLGVYVRHYNEQRPHRALGLQAPDAAPIISTRPEPASGPTAIRRRDLLGGLIHEYEPAAAA